MKFWNGWTGWIRTSGMTESKSVALPLGDGPTKLNQTAHIQMGWIVGIEPTTSRATIWRANQLRYTHHIKLGAPIRARTWDLLLRRQLLYPTELLAHLKCSNKTIKWSGWWESNPHNQLGRLGFYHWTTPAQQIFIPISIDHDNDYIRIICTCQD